jgi:hypothetical protein
MANPNIVNVTSITGITTYISIDNTNTMNVFLSNANSSGKVLKINTIMAVSDDPAGSNVDVTIKLFNEAAGAGTSFSLATNITIPGKSSVVILGKDNPIYLTESKSLAASASASNDADIICSYEEIS